MENVSQGNGQQNAQQGVQQQQQVQQANMPADFAKMIPEKFGGDLSKFVKSYSELESKLGQRVEQAQEGLQKAKINYQEIENRFYNSGQFTAEDMAALKQSGFSDRTIASWQKTYQNERTELAKNMTTNSDGEDAESVIKYFKENCGQGKKYSTAFRDSVETQLNEGRFGSWKDIVADYKSSKGETKAENTYKPGELSGVSGGIKDEKEWEALRASKEFRMGDRAFLANLEKRYNATPEHIRSKFR